jgi:hypothetical protein
LAEKENISLNQLITVALAEKLSALATEDYLGARAARASRERFDEALASVPAVPPEPPRDRLDQPARSPGLVVAPEVWAGFGPSSPGETRVLTADAGGRRPDDDR